MSHPIKRRYFDWAATAIPDSAGETSDESAGKAASTPAPFGNPSSIHAEGKAARKVLEEARSRCAGVLGVKAEELFFTSGGTESNAIVLFSLLCKQRGSVTLLYSAAEHPSVRENAAALEQTGVPCAAIGIEADGRVSEAVLERTLAKKPAVRMAAIMAVNNETGAVNNMRALSILLRSREGKGFPPIHLHCDAVQAAGKIPLDLYDWGIDSASISAHKLGGSRGIGLLWLKSPIIPLLRGGGQEKNIRPGTENTRGASDLAQVLEKYASKAALPSLYLGAAERMKALIAALQNTGSFIPIPADRKDHDNRFSPWILQGAFRNSSGMIIPGEVIVRALDEKGFALSTGSACSSAERGKRPILDAMGLDRETTLGGIRISQGWSTTMDDVEALAETIGELCRTL